MIIWQRVAQALNYAAEKEQNLANQLFSRNQDDIKAIAAEQNAFILRTLADALYQGRAS
jgi:hypothetical protein